jgi:hypothetical protein
MFTRELLNEQNRPSLTCNLGSRMAYGMRKHDARRVVALCGGAHIICAQIDENMVSHHW